MISDKSRIPIKTSNPLVAIQQIEGKQLRVDTQHQENSASNSPAVLEEIGAVVERGNQFAQTGQPNENPNLSDLVTEVRATAQQGTELNLHLLSREKELAEQEASYQVQVWNWQQEVAQTEQRLERKKSVLEEQESNLRSLQFELFQLQNELIASQMSMRTIVEDLAIPDNQLSALKSLKAELGDRFDHVMLTWREFAVQMNELAGDISEQVSLMD